MTSLKWSLRVLSVPEWRDFRAKMPTFGLGQRDLSEAHTACDRGSDELTGRTHSGADFSSSPTAREEVAGARVDANVCAVPDGAATAGNDRRVARDGRGDVHAMHIDEAPPSSSSSTAAPRRSPAGLAPPANAAGTSVRSPTAAELAARASKMFVVGAPEPTESDMGPVACQATKELIRHAAKAAGDLCDAHGPALSRSFGNFDRDVALGWLLGDALGKPLLSRHVAFHIGSTARQLVGSVKKQLQGFRRTASRARGKISHGDEAARQRVDDDAAAQEVALLQEPVAFDFCEAEEQPSCRRRGKKRARDDVSGDTREDPELVAAQGVCDDARLASADAAKELTRAKAKLENHLESPLNPHSKQSRQESDKLRAAVDEARSRVGVAHAAEEEANTRLQAVEARCWAEQKARRRERWELAVEQVRFTAYGPRADVEAWRAAGEPWPRPPALLEAEARRRRERAEAELEYERRQEDRRQQQEEERREEEEYYVWLGSLEPDDRFLVTRAASMSNLEVEKVLRKSMELEKMNGLLLRLISRRVKQRRRARRGVRR